MKNIFFALILNFFFIQVASADENIEKYKKECMEFINRPKVELFSSYGKLQYRFDKDESFLKKETEKKFAEENMVMDEDFLPVGLTKVRDVFDFNFTAGTLVLNQNYQCVYPETINVRLAYSMPTIYILNTLEVDSCLYDLAIRHEKTHMQIYIESLDYFLPKLKQYMNGLFDELGVMVVSKNESSELAAQKLNANYLGAIQAKVEAWQHETALEQLKLDTPENYIIENMVCQSVENKEN